MILVDNTSYLNAYGIDEDGIPVRRASERKKMLLMLVAVLLIAVLVSVTTVVLLELKNNGLY